MNSESVESGLAIELIDPLSDPRWIRLITLQPSLVFHSPAWLKTVCDTYGFEIKALLLYGNDGPAAGLVFAVSEDSLGRRIAGLAFSDYCDPVCQSPTQAETLYAGLVERYPDDIVKLRLLDAPAPGQGFEAAGTARWHGLELSGDESDMWERLHSKVRYDIRMARKNNVLVRPLEHSELRGFYELQLAVRKHRYRLMAQPYAFFENVWKNFVDTGQGLFLGAFLDNRLIGGYCLLFWKEVLTHKFGASDYAFKSARPNHLLTWEMIRLGLARGFSLIDLGLSDDDQSGLIRYKERLGSYEKTITNYLRAAGKAKDVDSAFSALSKITLLATDPAMPDAVTERFGEALYRFFM